MKYLLKNKTPFLISGIALTGLILYSCSTANRIYTEKDVVYSTKRFELKYNVRDRVRRSPLLYYRQTITKEINPENKTLYTAFDVLTLSAASFGPDEKVFLIIDNEPYRMMVDRIEFENVRNLSEDKQNVMTSDSTTISVITGYSENNVKLAKFSYKIPGEIISKIRNSNQFLIRYYSGPSMMTVKPKKKSIKKLKELIDAV
jgi:hypothetical protein